MRREPQQAWSPEDTPAPLATCAAGRRRSEGDNDAALYSRVAEHEIEAFGAKRTPARKPRHFGRARSAASWRSRDATAAPSNMACLHLKDPYDAAHTLLSPAGQYRPVTRTPRAGARHPGGGRL
jgi:hypothetical protein